MTRVQNIGIVLLAAGESRRLGKPKQHLIFEGQTLLTHTVLAAINSDAKQTVLVIGNNDQESEKSFDFNNLHLIVNHNWQEGMSSSIRVGITSLLNLDPDIDAAVVLVCDQPFISEKIINDLIEAYLEFDPLVVASSYNGIVGVPVLFNKKVFPELLQLTGDVGAKQIIKKYTTQMRSVDFSKGTMDIDTMEDYEQLLKSNT